MACLMAVAVGGCGGGKSTSTPATPDEIVSFAAVQDAGQSVVIVNGPPKVNFAVYSANQALKTDLTLANVSFAIAKLVPGSNGNPDQWVNYIYRKETATAGVGPLGVPALASAMQATTDAKTSATLLYNAEGYYTYTFTTDITNPAKTNGVVFEPGLTHRVAIQLSYTNPGGDTVRVNPYFDFTLDANGKSVPVTDPAKTRKMTDVASCNGCHDKLALHGGGRVDTQYCVMCHNPGTTDANSGNNLNLATMVHKIHAGKLLMSQLATGAKTTRSGGTGTASTATPRLASRKTCATARCATRAPIRRHRRVTTGRPSQPRKPV